SRRRHTRSKRDWSSDVCSSDLMLGTIFFGAFMFSVGYRIGPQLLVSLKLFGIRILIASIFWMVVAFLVGWSLFSAFKIGPGIAAGVISGALTQIGRAHV